MGGPVRYRFALVDHDDEDSLDLLRVLHVESFGDTAPVPKFSYGWWYVGREERGEPVAFCGVVESTIGPGVGYLKRAGVIGSHRGRGLQRRMLLIRERRARRAGLSTVITDTTDNVPSANNLIRAGYRLFEPEVKWSFDHSLYWRKDL